MVKHELRGNSTLGDLCVFACSAFYLTTWHNIQQLMIECVTTFMSPSELVASTAEMQKS
jgi:hypothetical protein